MGQNYTWSALVAVCPATVFRPQLGLANPWVMVQNIKQITVRFRVIGYESMRFPVAGRSLVQFPLQPEGVAKGMVRPGGAGLEMQRLPGAGRRLVQLSQRRQGAGEVNVCLAVGRIEAESLTVMGHRPCWVADFLERVAQEGVELCVLRPAPHCVLEAGER